MKRMPADILPVSDSARQPTSNDLHLANASQSLAFSPDEGLSSLSSAFPSDNGLSPQSSSFSPAEGLSSQSSSFPSDKGLSPQSSSFSPTEGQSSQSSAFSPDKGLSPQPSSFLMVCLGNICRSPLAEGILEEKARAAGLQWKIDSAGTNGYHIGEAPHRLSQKVARTNGVDISRQRARKFSANDFQRFDKIYAMAEDVVDEMKRIAGRQFDPTKVELLMNELHPGRNEDVPDPYYGGEEGYHEVYRMIDAAAERIIGKYGRSTSPNPGATGTQSQPS